MQAKVFPCPKCQRLSTNDVECSFCGIILAKAHRDLNVFVASEELASQKEEVLYELKSFDRPQLTLAAWPCFFLLAILFQKVNGLHIISILISTIPMHELGHAVAAWLGGRLALPMPFGFTFMLSDRIFILNLAVSILFGFGIFKCLIQKRFYLGIILLFLFGIHINFAYLKRESEFDIAVSAGGIAGEILLSALILFSYFHDISQRLRWDFWRLPLGQWAAFSFVNAWIQWHHIARKIEPMPMGSAMSIDGPNEASGDLNKLMGAGYNEKQIVGMYLLMLKWSAFIILGRYLIYIFYKFAISRESPRAPSA